MLLYLVLQGRPLNSLIFCQSKSLGSSSCYPFLIGYLYSFNSFAYSAYVPIRIIFELYINKFLSWVF